MASNFKCNKICFIVIYYTIRSKPNILSYDDPIPGGELMVTISNINTQEASAKNDNIYSLFNLPKEYKDKINSLKNIPEEYSNVIASLYDVPEQYKSVISTIYDKQPKNQVQINSIYDAD